MSDSFLDSNVILYVFDETQPSKQMRAKQLVRKALETDDTISFQIVQEVLNALRGKMVASVSRADADDFLRTVLVPLWTVMPHIATVLSRDGH